MWKGLIHQYKEFLPVTDQTPALTLHEGNTPLIHLPKLSEQLGIELHVKTEGV
ncbi:threonine synthase, partial [Xanthomonas citri pv. citri]|nr:threonine synthase [Xanthomonas citri pv. citri]